MGCAKSIEQVEPSDCVDIVYDFKKAKVIDVYDGDTVTIAAYYNGAYRSFKVRIFGVNTAELRKQRGVVETDRERTSRVRSAALAKNYTTNVLLGRVVDIKVLNNYTKNKRQITDLFGEYINAETIDHYMKSGKKYTEKYGRLLANIYIDGTLFATNLIRQKLAVPYLGVTLLA